MPNPAQPSHHTDEILRKLRAKLDTALSRHLMDILDTRRLKPEVTPAEKARLRGRVERVAATSLRHAWQEQLTPEERGKVVDELVRETLGLGPLEPLLADPTVSEVMVNGPSEVFVERNGRLERAEVTFRDEDQVMGLIERALAQTGRRVSQAEPYADARLTEGVRMNVVVAPIALAGPIVTLRKSPRRLFSMEELIRLGTLTREAAEFLRLCVLGRLNLLVSGPASAGKTTLMNVLAEAIPLTERVIVVEDVAELHLPQRHVVRLETRPATVEGTREVTLQHLLRNAVHMRPDRILIGEIRGSEAVETLQAMNVGHDGSMTTVHANTPQDVVNRLVALTVPSRPELAAGAIAQQFHAAVDVIAHLERLGDGRRMVTHVTEVRRQTGEEGLVDLFTLTEERLGSWTLRPTGKRPLFLQRLRRRGVHVPEALFLSST